MGECRNPVVMPGASQALDATPHCPASCPHSTTVWWSVQVRALPVAPGSCSGWAALSVVSIILDMQALWEVRPELSGEGSGSWASPLGSLEDSDARTSKTVLNFSRTCFSGSSCFPLKEGGGGEGTPRETSKECN